MNIIVINGSPLGEKGVSAHYTAYLARKLPEHRFDVLEVARKIRSLERDRACLDDMVDRINTADAILWCFPVYFMLVPAQLKRFIELLMERSTSLALTGKVATAISSSAHFYDHTAHDYLRGISSDMGLVYVQGFSAGMGDLLTEQGRRDLLGFFDEFLGHACGKIPVDAPVPPLLPTGATYEPKPQPVSPVTGATGATGAERIVVVSDAGSGPEDRNLRRMIQVLVGSLSHPVDLLELQSLNMKGGCLGCMRCADDGACGYKDDYARTFDERIKPAHVVIYAGRIRDRFFSARHKMFIDRYFRYGHRPAAAQRQLLGYLVSGPLQQLPAMNEILEATVQVARGQRLGIVTDESPDSDVITARLRSMACRVDSWLERPWFLPSTFLGVGGTKIFRDLVYENKGMLSADHRFYRASGLYDFPQRNLRKRLVMATMLLCKRVPLLAPRVKKALRTGHTRRHSELLKRTQPGGQR